MPNAKCQISPLRADASSWGTAPLRPPGFQPSPRLRPAGAGLANEFLMLECLSAAAKAARSKMWPVKLCHGINVILVFMKWEGTEFIGVLGDVSADIAAFWFTAAFAIPILSPGFSVDEIIVLLGDISLGMMFVGISYFFRLSKNL